MGTAPYELISSKATLGEIALQGAWAQLDFSQLLRFAFESSNLARL